MNFPYYLWMSVLGGAIGAIVLAFIVKKKSPNEQFSLWLWIPYLIGTVIGKTLVVLVLILAFGLQGEVLTYLPELPVQGVVEVVSFTMMLVILRRLLK